MKQFGLIVLLGASFATAAMAHDPKRKVAASASPSAARCGGTLWRMKTLSDRDRFKVHLNAKGTTVGAIRNLTPPRQLPRRRTTGFQKQTWEVVAQVVAVRRDGTEMRLQLYDHGAYMTAAIPAPSCLSTSTRARPNILSAWSAFGTCGRHGPSWESLGPVAYVRGVGFWTRRSVDRSAANGAELHPVTGFRIVVGCG